MTAPPNHFRVLAEIAVDLFRDLEDEEVLPTALFQDPSGVYNIVIFDMECVAGADRKQQLTNFLRSWCLDHPSSTTALVTDVWVKPTDQIGDAPNWTEALAVAVNEAGRVGRQLVLPYTRRANNARRFAKTPTWLPEDTIIRARFVLDLTDPKLMKARN